MQDQRPISTQDQSWAWNLAQDQQQINKQDQVWAQGPS
jgi:hypothetical protein